MHRHPQTRRAPARSRGRRAVGSLIAAVVTGVLAAGCSSPAVAPTPLETPSAGPTVTATASTPAPAPSSTPPPSASAGPTPSARPTPTPSAPPAPTPTTSAGLRQQLHAATVAFYAAIAHGYKTYDTSRIEQMSEPSCTACRAYINSIREVKKNGYRYTVFGEYIIGSFTISRDKIFPESWDSSFRLKFTGLERIDSDGNILKKQGVTYYKASIIWHKVGSSWFLREQYIEEE